MLNFSESNLESLVIHKVGNKYNEEGFQLSEKEVGIDEELTLDVLKKYFLSSFKSDVFYHFNKDEGNEVFELVSRLIDDEGSFIEISNRLAERLYNCSEHQRVKSGEFYLARFSNCIIEDEICDAIGIFKSEQKDTFLKIFSKNNSFSLTRSEGINIKRLDKGCLIFNSEREHGFRVVIVDSGSQGEEARYWKDDFLKLRHRDENFYHTQSYISLVKNFVKDVVDEELHHDKKEQAVLLNRTAGYFAGKEDFNSEDFEKEVFNQPGIVESFRRYKEDFEEEKNYKINDEFNISEQAYKNSKKFLRSVIKLDKNFHVYVHGKEEYLEKGYDDEKRLNFYKLFFNAES